MHVCIQVCSRVTGDAIQISKSFVKLVPFSDDAHVPIPGTDSAQSII